MMVTPLFIQAPHGRLFGLYYPPLSGDPTALILHVPAFAEEMNKSRRMVALQSIQFHQNNVGVLVLDLFGTGDSEGLLENASWEIWQADLEAATTWLKQQHPQVPFYLWGLRFGCALATSYAAQPNTDIYGLIYWQPLFSAKRMLTQFLRLRVASAMTNKATDEERPETTKSLFQDLADGRAVEVGGYLLSPEFFNSIIAIDVERQLFENPKTMVWLDFVSGQSMEPSLVNSKVIHNWVQQKNDVKWRAVHGDRFWNTQEIAVCSELISRTLQMLGT